MRPKQLVSKRGQVYLVQECLGQGAFGHVYSVIIDQGLKKPQKSQYVCKVEQRHQSDHASLLFEAWVIRKLNIYNVTGVVRLVDFVSESKYIAIIMEQGGQSLQHYFETTGPLHTRPILFLRLFKSALQTFKQIHDVGFIHRDIKPANILVEVDKQGSNADLKIIDFGMVCRYKKQDGEVYKDPQVQPLMFLGTPPYAPIAAHNAVPQAPKDDIESLCYSFIYLYLGRLPWRGQPFQSETDRYKSMNIMKQNCTMNYNAIVNLLGEGQVPEVVCQLLWESRREQHQMGVQRYDSFIQVIDKTIEEETAKSRRK